jgi:hypothetical protein
MFRTGTFKSNKQKIVFVGVIKDEKSSIRIRIRIQWSEAGSVTKFHGSTTLPKTLGFFVYEGLP